MSRTIDLGLVKGEDGRDGRDGIDGLNGRDGINGKSAYDIAVENGFSGTEQEWLESLKATGASAEQVNNIVAQYIKDNNIGSPSTEDITNAVNNYLAEHPVAGGATEEEHNQIYENKDDIEEVKKNLSQIIEVTESEGSSKNLFNVPDQEKTTPNGALGISVNSNIFTMTKIKATSAGSNAVMDGEFMVDEDGDYTLSSVFDIAIGRAFNIYVWNYDTNAVISASSYINQQIPTRVIPLNSGVRYGYRIGINNASDFNTLFSEITIKIQLEKGNIATEWESPSSGGGSSEVIVKGVSALEKRCLNIEQFLNAASTENPLDFLSSDPGFFGQFEKIACIGDSLTAGNLNYNGASSGEAVGAYTSYPSYLGRLTGCTIHNLGKGGMCAGTANTDRSWIRWADGYSRQWLGDNYVSNAYIIALGTNDIAVYGSFTGSVPQSIDDYDGTTDTSVGGYISIINRIIEKQPKAKIFCVCIPNTRNTKTTRSEANAKIKAIANLFPNSCYVIDLQTYGVSEEDVPSWKEKFYNGGHLNGLGYCILAKMYLTYINWIIINNFHEFRNMAFIGTDYNYE